MIAVASIIIALAAPIIAPYPSHAGLITNFEDKFLPPSLKYLFGTDEFGRDVLSRTIFGFQYSLMMAAVVLGLVVLPGVILGLVAGYYRGTWVDTLFVCGLGQNFYLYECIVKWAKENDLVYGTGKSRGYLSELCSESKERRGCSRIWR